MFAIPTCHDDGHSLLEADYHHTNSRGSRPIHTVPRKIRTLLVKYLSNWSFSVWKCDRRLFLEMQP